MPLFLIVSEIYGRKFSKWWKIRNFFELFGPPCRNALADLDDSTQECAQVHIGLHLASLRKIEMVAVLCTNETTPQFFWVFNSPSPAPGADGPHRGGARRQIVPTQIIFGVALLRYRSKPPKCKNSPLTPIVTKISFALFFPPAGGRQPPKGEKWRPDPGYAHVRTLAWIGPRVAEKSLTEQKKQTKKHTVKQIPRSSL